jgi:hypothetical protein
MTLGNVVTAKAHLWCATAIFALAPFAAHANDGRVLSDLHLTLGAVAENHADAICVRGDDREHRVWHDKAGTLAKYGVSLSAADQYEDDDLVPVCLGGDNASPQNHWPQSYAGKWGADRKDELERRLCAEICRTRDDAELARYQADFPENWIALYQMQHWLDVNKRK